MSSYGSTQFVRFGTANREFVRWNIRLQLGHPVGTVVSGRTGKLKYSRGGNRTGVLQALKPAANDLGWTRKTPHELKNDMIE